MRQSDYGVDGDPGLGPFVHVFRLRDDGMGLACNAAGVFLGPDVALLERRELPGGRPWFRPRPYHVIAAILRAAYGTDFDPERRQSGLAVVARALNGGNLALATIAAVQMRLPDLDPDALARLARADRLLKAGFDPGQPRGPAGNPDGGQWTPAGGSGGDGSGRSKWQGSQRGTRVTHRTSCRILAPRARRWPVVGVAAAAQPLLVQVHRRHRNNLVQERKSHHRKIRLDAEVSR
jgi:hypothetical protein